MANFLKSLFVKGVEIDTASATTGKVLTYDGTKFAPAAPGAGSLALDDLSDAVITSPYKYQSLIYDGTNWVNDDASTITYVRNAEATTLNVGEVVYLYQQQGDRASVKRAINTGDSTSAKTLGVVAVSIAANADGPVVTQGYVTGCTLGSFTAGQTVYLGATAGTITSTKPYAPNHLVYIGVVVRANNGNGILYVRAQNGYELDEIHDVDLTTTPPTAGQYLKFGGTLWTADTIDLGTDTTGDYVGTITAGTGVTTSGASTGEGIAHSISIGQSVATSATPQFAGGLFIGDTTVQSAASRDRIVLRGRAGGTSNYGMFVTTDTLTVSRQIMLPDTNGTVVTTGDTGTVTSTMLLDGTIVNGDINTSAAIALSKLASGTSAQVVIANGSGVPTYTTISGDITISNTGVATIAADSVALGTDTTGNYVGTITAGTGVTTSGASTGEGIAHSISLTSAYGDTLNPYGTKAANFVLSGPTTGADAVPTFRALVNADIPSALTGKTYNGLTVTSSTGTLTVTNAKTLSVSNTLTLAGTDSTTMTFPATSSTVMTLANPGTLTGSITLRAGTATAGTAPLYLTSGTNLTAAVAGAMEFDGTNLYFSPSTTRKTIAFTDSAITSSTYIGTTSVALNRASANLALTGITSIALPGSTSGTTTFQPSAVAGTTTITLPAVTGTVITTGDTGTVTNTMLAGSIATSKITGLATSATTDTTNANNITSGLIDGRRLSGSYTGITGIGTLSSLTVDGASSPAIAIGDWASGAGFASIVTSKGYLLLGATSGNDEVYLRSTTAGTAVRIGGNQADMLVVGGTTASFAGDVSNSGSYSTAGYFISTSGLAGSGQAAQWLSAFSQYYLMRVTSTRNDKENVQPLNGIVTPSMVDDINVLLWSRKGASGFPEIGPMAEDMDEISPFLSSRGMDYDEDGNIISTPPEGINQNSWLSLLTIALQDSRKRIKELEDLIK